MNISALTYADKIYAFFDVDDTLIGVKSMLSFQDFWYQTHQDPKAEHRYRQDLVDKMLHTTCWKSLNRLYYRHFRGRSVSEVTKMGHVWFDKMRKDNPHFYHKNVLALLQAHQNSGHEPVFVSGSFPALLQPIADDLQVGFILSTKMEVVDGYYTGEILPPQTIGEGKAEAMQAFLSKQHAHPEHCYAYGDDWSDIPMLEAVGHACVVAGGRGLEAHARKVNWRLLNPH